MNGRSAEVDELLRAEKTPAGSPANCLKLIYFLSSPGIAHVPGIQPFLPPDFKDVECPALVWPGMTSQAKAHSGGYAR